MRNVICSQTQSPVCQKGKKLIRAQAKRCWQMEERNCRALEEGALALLARLEEPAMSLFHVTEVRLAFSKHLLCVR